ncbi:hypothetical protein, partial [Moritella sp. PE36]|uniref:hypothetical protein n=1 Tax=Moritella sp. PE36 TaxID=58051 RepID=UPI001E53727A
SFGLLPELSVCRILQLNPLVFFLKMFPPRPCAYKYTSLTLRNKRVNSIKLHKLTRDKTHKTVSH